MSEICFEYDKLLVFAFTRVTDRQLKTVHKISLIRPFCFQCKTGVIILGLYVTILLEKGIISS